LKIKILKLLANIYYLCEVFVLTKTNKI